MPFRPHPCAAPARFVGASRLAKLAAVLLLAAATTPVAARSPSPVEGVALVVQDGDSFTMRADDGRRLRIRVSGIDAPERHQPYADVSRRHLGDLLRDQRLRIDPIKQDVFDRTVATVRVLDDERPPVDAGLSQIEAGLAWHFARYRADQPASDFERYARAERGARERRAGLWRDGSPEPPWEFRARARRGEAAPARRPSPDRED
jgi:endonuclease YncB( thermonuclease family)